MKIHSVFYVKKKNNKIFLFDFLEGSREGLSQVIKFSDENNLDYSIDGLEWICDNERYSLSFKANEFGKCHIHNDKIFIVYKSSTSDFSPPNNLVIYNAIGEIKKYYLLPFLH